MEKTLKSNSKLVVVFFWMILPKCLKLYNTNYFVGFVFFFLTVCVSKDLGWKKEEGI